MNNLLWHYPRLQFQGVRFLLGLSLSLYFASLFFNQEASSYWPMVFPILQWSDLVTSFPNVLAFIPLELLLVVLMVTSLVIAFTHRRKFLSSVILYGLACLHQGEVVHLNPVSILIFSYLMILFITPESEHRIDRWRFPYGVFIFGHTLLVFTYLILLNPFSIPEELMTSVEHPLPMPIRVILTLGVLTLTLRLRRYIFWFFSVVCIFASSFAILTYFEAMLLLPLLVLTIDPRWWVIDEEEETLRVLYYDGECGLCQRAVRFCLENDPRGLVKYCPLQSPEAKKRIPVDLHSYQELLEGVIYENGGKYTIKSTAILILLRDLGGIWKLLSLSIWLPESFRHKVYDLIAGSRLKWFGQVEYCEVPYPLHRERFVGAQYDQES